MDEIVKTTFNSSMASLERIDKLLRELHQAVLDNSVVNYYKLLQCLRKEAFYKMNGKWKPLRDTLELEWSVLEKDFLLIDKHVSSKIPHSFFQRLERFELSLRDFMEERGMLISDDPGAGLGEDEW
jgi:hypothetical protein